MFLLVDTGSDVSLLPALEYHKRHPPQLTLFAANSSTINVYGQKTLSLDLNVRREFIWTFLLASVKTPILGADFLHYFELVPDLRHKCLRDLKPNFKQQKTRSTVPQPTEQLQWNDAADAAFRLAKNAIAEAALLRHPIPGASLSIWVDASGWLFFAEAQTIDSELQQFLHDSTSSLHLELKPCQISDHNLICDTSTGTPFVPTTFRKLIFEHLHNLSHPGIAATTKLICSRYVWPCMKTNKNMGSRLRQMSTIQSTEAQITSRYFFSTPDARFSHIHIDIVGPLPPSDGFQYLLTMIDKFSRWPEAVPIPDTTAKTISRAIFHHWIARFDVLRLSQQIKAPRCDHRYLLNLHGFLEQMRLKQPHTIPISNGLVERFHRHLKASIKAHESSRWTDVLPIVLLGIRSAVKEDLKASCAELVYGTTLRLPSDMLNVSIIPPCDEEFITSLRNIMRHLNPVATSTHGHSAHFVHPALSSCTHVFLRIDKVSPPLTQPYTGPHEVIARTDKTLQIIINSKPSWVSIDRVKPAFFVSQDFEFS
ncbi:transposon Ty3-G Gag-Pol polyprotein [Trichonephila clavipes]|nr:transposon Ty3-G Gag-Pol polyprotein [Trichonephila clavipes]